MILVDTSNYLDINCLRIDCTLRATTKLFIELGIIHSLVAIWPWANLTSMLYVYISHFLTTLINNQPYSICSPQREGGNVHFHMTLLWVGIFAFAKWKFVFPMIPAYIPWSLHLGNALVVGHYTPKSLGSGGLGWDGYQRPSYNFRKS